MFIGYVTDSYQSLEENMKKLLEQLKNADVSISIATKSDLILRDSDLIKKFPNVKVYWPFSTLYENFKNDMNKSLMLKDD